MSHIFLELNPVWENLAFEFEYETKFAKRLDLKRLRIECWDHDYLKSNDYIGAVELDLLTLVTGPEHYTLTLKDVRKIFIHTYLIETRQTFWCYKF